MDAFGPSGNKNRPEQNSPRDNEESKSPCAIGSVVVDFANTEQHERDSEYEPASEVKSA